MRETPVDNLVRARYTPGSVSLRAPAMVCPDCGAMVPAGAECPDCGATMPAMATGRTMFGHFAVFNEWTEIDSWFEGQFMERIAPTAFNQTFQDRGNKIRILYDHGQDPSIGNKPLGAPDVLRVDKIGPYYECELFDAGYVNDLLPALRANQLGASFRFAVTSESWVDPKEPSDYNPSKLRERTITGVDLYEFGPVTFPAYESATAGLRSRTDEFLQHFIDDPKFVARFRERVGPTVVEQIRASLPMTSAEREPTAPTAPETKAPTAPPDISPDETTDGGDADSRTRRLDWFNRITAGYVAHTNRLERSNQ